MAPDQKALIELLEKFVLPLAVALVSWFIKDYLVGTFAKREEVVRAEWAYRLKEIWSPLFYWSGVVLFGSGGRGWDRHGAKELEAILAKSAHLLPLVHYKTLLELLEVRGRNMGHRIALDRVLSTRDFVYKQIEIYNYLLFRRAGWFDPVERTDLFGTARGMMRLMSQTIFHVAVWVLLCTVFGLLYWAYVNEINWIIALVIIAIAGVSSWDAKSRWNIYKSILKATEGR